ncbi:unnamed protein product [Amoebophrya sp. A25]|nr:unnamed protein product [Amoebophrya sp. A25]|eukprot:GSA25T00010741001.1
MVEIDLDDRKRPAQKDHPEQTMSFLFSVRASGRNVKLTLPSADPLVVEILAAVEESVGIPAANQVWRGGFPPKKIDLPDSQVGVAALTAKEAGIQSRDLITVEESPTPVREIDVSGYKGLSENAARSTGASSVAASSAMPTGSSATTGASSVAASSAAPTGGKQQQQEEASSTSAATTHGKSTTTYRYKVPSANDVAGSSGSFAERHVIAADNSCLFNAILFDTKGIASAPSAGALNAETLRKFCADTVRGDPCTYDPLTLAESGRTSLEYADWITKKDSWGGFMELSILSTAFGIQIVAVDVISTRMEYFPHDSGSLSHRIFVFFDGIHYDACRKGGMSVFSVNDEAVLNEVMAVAIELKENKQFTDTANFTLQCQHCFKLLKGEKDAQQHAKETGHFNFQEAPR